MNPARFILYAAIPGLMFCIIPADDVYARFSWQLVSVWLAGTAFCCWLKSWWHRIFFLLAIAQIIMHGPVITSYMSLLMIGIFLAAIQGYGNLKPDSIMHLMCTAGLLLCGWIYLQKIGMAGSGGLGDAAAGPFNINAASCFLAICLPAFFRRGWWMLLPAIVWGIFACRSTTGFMTMMAACAAYLMTKRMGNRKWWAIAAAISVLGVIFLWKIDPLNRLYVNKRWAAWERTVMAYSSAPLGRGLGSFRDVFPKLTAGDQRLHETDGRIIVGKIFHHAHNEYLQTGFEMGIQALGLIMAYLAWIVISIFRRAEEMEETEILSLSGIAATAVGAAGFHIFHIATTALLGCAWLGIWEGRRPISPK